MLADAVERVRRLTFDLHPPLLGTHGLSVALADLIDRAARDGHIETDVVVELGRYPFVVEDMTYASSARRSPTPGRTPTPRVEIDVREHRGVVHGRVWDDGANEPARRAEDRPACCFTGASNSSASGCAWPTATSTFARCRAVARSSRSGCRSPTGGAGERPASPSASRLRRHGGAGAGLVVDRRRPASPPHDEERYGHGRERHEDDGDQAQHPAVSEHLALVHALLVRAEIGCGGDRPLVCGEANSAVGYIDATSQWPFTSCISVV